MRIVFMGTPDFAACSLQRLLDDGHELAAVFCQPDKPQGRHFVLAPPPVKELALRAGIPVFQPPTLRAPEPQALLRELAPELIVVAAYGKLLPPAVLELPARGCINVHGSLLPRYRGAAPIQWAVIDHEPVTGVTIMHMATELDAGDLLLSRETPIGPDETAGELFERIAQLGADALSEALGSLDTLIPQPQDDRLACWARPLKKEDGAVDWSGDAEAIFARIRGVSPWPGAYTVFRGRRLKVLRAARCDASGAVGTLLDAKRLLVGCGSGALELLEVQLEGTRRIDGAAFVNGQRLQPGDSLF
ncbi:MAG: methionyl-tRNA formyltransferase [Oscillospiraceae bacterium]